MKPKEEEEESDHMGKMSIEDKTALQFWRKTHPLGKCRGLKKGDTVRIKGTKITAKIIEVRRGSKATLFSSQGVGKPIKVSGIGRTISIAVKTPKGKVHFGKPKDLKKIKRRK